MWVIWFLVPRQSGNLECVPVVRTLADQDSPTVPDVGQVNFAAVSKNGHTRATREPDIYLWRKSIIYLLEWVSQALLNFGEIRVHIATIGRRHQFSDSLMQVLFQVFWHNVTVLAVAVAHREVVAMRQTKHVRIRHVGILVLLVGVRGVNAGFRCETILGDHILKFFWAKSWAHF